MASSLLLPQTSMSAVNAEHTAGRSGWPKIWHRLSTDNCTQRSPAGLPWGMPGMGELMEGAMQQAPQPSRHFMTRNTSRQLMIGNNNRVTAKTGVLNYRPRVFSQKVR
jgi:hypothetical protein